MGAGATPVTLQLAWLNRHGVPYRTDRGEVHLTTPERLPHQQRDDTSIHVCRGGERLIDVAMVHFKDYIDWAADCWEVIAQFQDPPIVDGSVPLPHGTVLQIPSLEYVQEVAFGDPLHEYPVL